MEAITSESVETQSMAAHLTLPAIHFDYVAPPVEAGNSVVPYAAYDIGSGGTKFMGALLNVETMTIDQIFSQGSFPVAYRQDLYQSETNEFSDLIQELGIQALQAAKKQIEHDYVAGDFQYGEIQHFAIATAAFREAKNGELVASYFEDKLDFPVNIISQEEEGKLAYYSASSQLDPAKLEHPPIVWDIGGGSMQLTYKDQFDHFHIMEGQVASQTFQSLISETLLHKEPTASPNPMTESDVEAAIDLAKAHLLFDPTITAIIKQQVTDHAPIIAVGSVHNFTIQPLCNLAGTHSGDHYYTKDDVYLAINLLTDKRDEQIQKLMSLANADFAKNQLTNLILVYAMMDIMGIDRVQTVKSSNVEGLLLKNASKNEIASAKIDFIQAPSVNDLFL